MGISCSKSKKGNFLPNSLSLTYSIVDLKDLQPSNQSPKNKNNKEPIPALSNEFILIASFYYWFRL